MEVTAKVLVERQGAVAVLRMVSPPVNALDLELMTALRSAVVELTRGGDAANRPRALLLTSGLPGQFCAGVDLQAITRADIDGRRQLFRVFADLVESLWLSYTPVIADVSGPALAGGAVLAALADFALIDGEHGKLCFSEIKVGLPLPRFVQRIVLSKIGGAGAAEVMLLARNLDADDAVRRGLALAVYRSPEQRAAALSGIVSRLTRLSPAALSQSLRDLRAPERGLFDEFRNDMSVFADFLSDQAIEHGLRAVLRLQGKSAP